MSPSPRVRSLLGWAGGLACVAAAWGVIAVTPGDEFADQPFVVQARLGEPAEGREMRITVLEAQKASHVEDEHGWSADGTWVLVEFEGEALTVEEDASLNRLQLRIGQRVYVPSDRPARADPDGQLHVGVPETMTAAFEIAEEDAEKRAVLDLGFVRADERLDSAIRLDLDLSALDTVDGAEIPDRRWSE